MRRIIVISVIAVLFCACSSIDCPLNNTIYCVYSLKGDVEMLTAYPDLKMGLIIDWGRNGAIRELADRHDGKYFSQQFKK